MCLCRREKNTSKIVNDYNFQIIKFPNFQIELPPACNQQIQIGVLQIEALTEIKIGE